MHSLQDSALCQSIYPDKLCQLLYHSVKNEGFSRFYPWFWKNDLPLLESLWTLCGSAEGSAWVEVPYFGNADPSLIVGEIQKVLGSSFRYYSELPSFAGIYCLFNSKRLLYVGEARSIRNRLNDVSHPASSLREFVYCYPTSNRSKRLDLEGSLIRTFDPLCNLTHKPLYFLSPRGERYVRDTSISF